MSGVKEKLEVKLTEAFAPDALQVIDESAMHAGHASAPAGGESHFRIRIKSKAFEGLSRIKQHRMIYDACGDLLRSQIHALAIEVQNH